MSRRWRLFTAAVPVVTLVVVLVLLVYSVVASHNLAESRQRASIEAADRNAELLDGLNGLVRDVRDAQRNQRQAFRRLAERNEELHGSDPSEAPRFNGTRSEPQRDPPRESRQPEPSPRPPPPRPPSPKPKPKPPPPSPTVCVPVLDVCL